VPRTTLDQSLTGAVPAPSDPSGAPGGERPTPDGQPPASEDEPSRPNGEAPAPIVRLNDPAEVARSHRFCAALTKSRARNFCHGIRLTPKPKRGAMYAVYAWTRFADDLADEADDRDRALSQLVAFRTLTRSAVTRDFTTEDAARAYEELRGASPCDGRVWPALAEAVQRFELNPADLAMMIDGQADDLTTNTRETFDDLYEYCNRVASSVGRMCVTIWGAMPGSDALQLAEWRGVSLQLTNILRDIREDYERGRVYLPREDFERFGLSVEDLLQNRNERAARAFLQFQIDRARRYYEQSEALESLIEPDCVATSLGIALVYRHLLDRIAADPLAVITGERVRLSRLTKWKTILTALNTRRRATGAWTANGGSGGNAGGIDWS